MKKKTKTMCKFLSVFLVFLIVAQILPLQVLAESITDAIAHKEFIENSLTPSSADDSSDATILYEVKEKRDEHTKVYKKSDGTYTAVKTVEPLHYLDDGMWEEINNSMTLNGNLYTNLDNMFNVEFPESIDSNENLTVEKDGYELSFSVDEIEESSAVVENDIVVSETNIAVADEAISQTQSSVTYNDVAENTDLQYIVTPNSIKENIIVSNKECVKDTYTFTFETNGLDAEKLDDGSIIFKDENSEIKFRIPRPVMTDSSLAFSYDINVDLIENADGTVTLEYSPSSDWTNSSDRVYPITIDPAITVNGEEPEFIEDTCVSYNSDDSNVANQNNADAYLTALTNMLTQENSDGTTTTMDSEIYTRIDTDFFNNLGNDIVFTEVQYIVAGITTVNGKIFAREILEDWDVNTVTYNTKPELSSEVIDYYTSPLNEGEEFDSFAYVHFNITKVFNEWFNGKTNNGFALTAVDDTVAFIVINGGSQNTAMVLDYVDMGGYNENYSYHTQLAGWAGTGYVNDFTQHLSVVREEVASVTTPFPLKIGMTYNSATYNKFKSSNTNASLLVYGDNWLPNYLTSHIFIDENHLTYYTNEGYAIDFISSTDSFGNVTFEELNCDEYGNHNYELEYHPASEGKEEYYTVIRPDGYFEQFNNDGLLTSIFDAYETEHFVNIEYDTLSRIANITDYCNNRFEYEYVANLLSKIKVYPYDCEERYDGNPIIYNYSYTNNCLTQIYLDTNLIISYEYDSYGNMTSMTDVNDYRVEYEYDSNNKITKVTEKTYRYPTYVTGNIITYDRSNAPQIKVTDNSSNYELYQFNSKGNLLYTIDSTEEDQSIIPGENNYIKNGDFTDANLDDWTGTDGCEIKESNINGKEVNALKLPGGTNTENTISQTVVLDGKKYDTIAIAAWFNGNFVKSTTNNTWLKNLISNSEDPKICNFTNDRYAQIQISYEYEDTTMGPSSETIVIPFSENFDDWQFVSEGFELKGDCTELIVTIHYTNNPNPALLSNVQLVKNGGYELSYYDQNDITSPLKSMSLGLRDVLSYNYDEKNETNKVVHTNSAYQKNVMDIIPNNSEVAKPTDIFINNQLKYHLSYNKDYNTTCISSADNRVVRYADDINSISSFSNNYLNSVKNNGGNYVEKINDIEYLTKVYDVNYNPKDGLSEEKSEVINEYGKGIGITSSQDWFGRRSNNRIEAITGYNTDSEKVSTTVESTYGYNETLSYDTMNHVKTYINNIYAEEQTNGLPNSINFAYEYDENGNVIKEYDYFSEHALALRYSFEYDEENRVVRYNDNVSETKYSYSYEYDNNGNLLSKSTYLYTPIEAELGEPISTEYYNVVPTLLDNETLVWNESNQLVSYTKTDDDNNTTQIEYAYDDNGTMIEKRVLVNGNLKEKFNYTWAYGKLINEVYTTNCNTEAEQSFEIRYVYDSFNSIQGFIFNKLNNSDVQSSTYLYLKNLQGDIIGIVNDSGNIVLTYGYDVFGFPTTTVKNNSDDNIGFIEKLPIKYRSCYYDYDINLYYVDGKYYSPETGKFLNSTDTDNATITDKSLNYSLISYWDSHPANYIDPVEMEIYYANITANYLYNKEITNKILEDTKNEFVFINDQSEGAASKYRFGFSLTGPVGCGWVATYNALIMLGTPMYPHDIIREFEMMGMYIHGCSGINPFVIVLFLKNKGIDITISLDKSQYDDIVQNSTASILAYTHSSGGHYISLQHKKDSEELVYTAYNENKSQTISGSLSNFISDNQKTVLISING